MKTAKQTYREVAASIDFLPVFSQPWWLDSVCGNENWDVVLYYKNATIVGILPYYIRHNLGMTILSQPELTQKLGPTIIYPTGAEYRKKLSLDKEIINGLIEQLPDHHLFRQTCDHRLNNWLPLYWLGFNQTTQYSYVIEDISDFDAVLMNFSTTKRKEVRRGIANLQIDYSINVDEFYDLHGKCLIASGKTVSYDIQLLRNIEAADPNREKHEYICVRDANGNLHSALLLIWDSLTTYNLISAIDTKYQKSGSTSLIVFTAIKNASKRGTSFDFEGSMIEEVEFSFRQFGGRQVQLFSIEKYNGKFLKLVHLIKNELRN